MLVNLGYCLNRCCVSLKLQDQSSDTAVVGTSGTKRARSDTEDQDPPSKKPVAASKSSKSEQPDPDRRRSRSEDSKVVAKKPATLCSRDLFKEGTLKARVPESPQMRDSKYVSSH